MDNNEFFKDYSAFVSFRTERYEKATLFENEHILVGLNCLEPGQEMEKHSHEVQCRFYLVLEGRGSAQVGEEVQDIRPGTVIWISTGSSHKIENTGTEPLVMLVGIAPTEAD